MSHSSGEVHGSGSLLGSQHIQQFDETSGGRGRGRGEVSRGGHMGGRGASHLQSGRGGYSPSSTPFSTTYAPQSGRDEQFADFGPTSSRGGHQSLLSADPRSTAPAEANKGGYQCATTLKWVGVAIALTATVVGVLGLLVYLGQLNVGWAGAGSLSQSMGLYIMLGGMGATAITTILLTVSCCLNRAKENAQKQRELQHQSRETLV